MIDPVAWILSARWQLCRHPIPSQRYGLPDRVMATIDVAALLGGGPPFEALIAQLMLPDNEGRAVAENVFTQLKEHPDALSSNFIAVLRTSSNMAHRQFAAVMLKRVSLSALHPTSRTLLLCHHGEQEELSIEKLRVAYHV